MRTPDLHPDELLDKAAEGALSEAERAQLDEHLRLCAVCRIEMKAQNDFSLELAHEASPIEIDDLVTRALMGAKTAPEPPPQRISDRPRRKRFTLAVALIAATFSAASVAAAARITGVWQPNTGSEEAIEVPTSVPPLPIPKKRPHAAPAEKMAAAEKTEEAPSEEADQNSIVAPEPPAPVEPPAAPPVLPAIAHRAPVAPKEPAPEPKVIDRDTPQMTPSTLFSEANAARVRGDHAIAIQGYRSFMHDFPSAPEARLSHVTLGKLLLDRGDARSALDELDLYLRTGDSTLREEALTAKAMAFSHIGNSSEEAAAWATLIDQFPNSMHVPKAKSRLAELNVH